MPTSQIAADDARPIAASCDDDHLRVDLADGRTLLAPLWWYPRLLAASLRARNELELSPMGVHWPTADEDISVASILRGERAPGAGAPRRVKL